MKVSAFWIVVAIVITWYMAKAHTRVMQKRGARRAGKLLSFPGGKATGIAGSTASIESRPIPQGEDLPTAI